MSRMMALMRVAKSMAAVTAKIQTQNKTSKNAQTSLLARRHPQHLKVCDCVVVVGPCQYVGSCGRMSGSQACHHEQTAAVRLEGQAVVVLVSVGGRIEDRAEVDVVAGAKDGSIVRAVVYLPPL